MSSDETVEVDCQVTGSTDAAYWINDGSGRGDVSIPKSLVSDKIEKNGVIVAIEIPEWLAFDNGLI